jgi:hypothetical protein
VFIKIWHTAYQGEDLSPSSDLKKYHYMPIYILIKHVLPSSLGIKRKDEAQTALFKDPVRTAL